MRGKFFIRI